MSSDSSDKLVEIGVIGRAHGVRGEMRVFLHNEGSDLLSESTESLRFLQDGRLVSYEIERVRMGAKHHVVAIAGIHTREQAEKMKGARLLVSRSQFPEPAPDEFYVDDLIGMDAWDDGVLLGKITSSRPQGEIEVVTIAGAETELDVPLVHQYVLKIDFKSKCILLQGTESLPRVKITSGRKGNPRV